MTSRLILIAHAPTEALRRAAFPLNEPILDRKGSEEVVWQAPRVERIYLAPEVRAQQTSHLLGLEGEIIEELLDCDYGTWRGRPMDEVQVDQPDGIQAWLTKPEAAPHGGESIEDLISRAGRWMESLNSVRSTIAITHPAVIRAAIIYALRIPAQTFWRFDIPPLSLTDLRFSRDVWTVRCAGCLLRVSVEEAVEP